MTSADAHGWRVLSASPMRLRCFDRHDVAQRDNPLRSADFFEAANHPKMTLVSKGIHPQIDWRLHVVGGRTIRGTTRSVGFDADRVTEESKERGP